MRPSISTRTTQQMSYLDAQAKIGLHKRGAMHIAGHQVPCWSKLRPDSLDLSRNPSHLQRPAATPLLPVSSPMVMSPLALLPLLISLTGPYGFHSPSV